MNPKRSIYLGIFWSCVYLLRSLRHNYESSLERERDRGRAYIVYEVNPQRGFIQRKVRRFDVKWGRLGTHVGHISKEKRWPKNNREAGHASSFDQILKTGNDEKHLGLHFPVYCQSYLMKAKRMTKIVVPRVVGDLWTIFKCYTYNLKLHCDSSIVIDMLIAFKILATGLTPPRKIKWSRPYNRSWSYITISSRAK